jgi:hypothetical protein
MWSSGGAQKLPLSDIPNLVGAMNRKLADPNKIDAKVVEQRLRDAAKDKDVVHVNLNQFLEAITSMSAPAPTVSAAAAEAASIASAHLALLPGQFSDELMQQCVAVHGRGKLVQLLRTVSVPEVLLREALVPAQSPAAVNYVKLVLISAGLTQPSPSEQDARAAMQSAGLFSAAERFTKAAVSSGYNEDLSLPAGVYVIHGVNKSCRVTLFRFGKPGLGAIPAARRSARAVGQDRSASGSPGKTWGGPEGRCDGDGREVYDAGHWDG